MLSGSTPTALADLVLEAGGVSYFLMWRCGLKSYGIMGAEGQREYGTVDSDGGWILVSDKWG